MQKFNGLNVIGAAIAATLLTASPARASLVLDTGTPPANGSLYPVSSTQEFAAEFTATAGAPITSVAAYLSQGSGVVGESTVTFDIYAGSPFLNTRSLSALASGTATFEGNGWTSSALNFDPTSTGTYWLAIEMPTSGRSNPSVDVVGGDTTSTGTAPALAFAYLGTGTSSQFTTSGAPGIGLQVTEASPVPEPAAIWLFSSGLLGLGGMRRWFRQSRGMSASG